MRHNFIVTHITFMYLLPCFFFSLPGGDSILTRCNYQIVIEVLIAGLIAIAPTIYATKAAQATNPNNPLWNVDLVTPNKKEFNLTALGGKVRVLSFFFTQCSTMCPIQTAKLAYVQLQLSSPAIQQSEFISISIDPLDDSLDRIADYQKRYHINAEHWRFAKTKDLNGLNQLLDKLAIDAKPSEETGELDHRMLIFLINPQGTVVQQYIGSRFNEARLIKEISTLIDIHNQQSSN